jgi:hypothetical protein
MRREHLGRTTKAPTGMDTNALRLFHGRGGTVARRRRGAPASVLSRVAWSRPSGTITRAVCSSAIRLGQARVIVQERSHHKRGRGRGLGRGRAATTPREALERDVTPLLTCDLRGIRQTLDVHELLEAIARLPGTWQARGLHEVSNVTIESTHGRPLRARSPVRRSRRHLP